LADRVEQQYLRDGAGTSATRDFKTARSNSSLHGVESFGMAWRDEESQVLMLLADFGESIEDLFLLARHRACRNPEGVQARESFRQLRRQRAVQFQGIVFEVAEHGNLAPIRTD